MTRQLALFGAVLFGGFLSATDAQAGSYDHLDRLALRAQSQSSQLYKEFKIHYRHARQQRHLMSDASSLYWKARHIHEVAHHGGDLYHLKRDVAEMDRLFHHLEDLVADIERHADHGHGHIHGRTGHVRSLMRQLENTIHHLQADLAALTRPRHRHDDHGHGVRVDRDGVTLGRGGIRFRIGF